MRNVHLAEWLLALVVSRENAASVAGDLLEEARTRGTVWFWFSLAGTVCSLLRRDLADNPIRMLRLAALGFVVQLALVVAAIVAFAFVTFAVGIAAMAVGLVSPQHSSPPWWLDARSGGPVVVAGTIFGYAAVLLSQFQVGRVLAKRSPGHELAPCVAMILIGELVIFGFNILSDGIRSGLYYLATYQLSSFLPFNVLLLAGAIRIRNRRTVA
jgi:hypothetical protein